MTYLIRLIKFKKQRRNWFHFYEVAFKLCLKNFIFKHNSLKIFNQFLIQKA